MNDKDEIIKGLFQASTEYPYFSKGFMALTPVEKNDIETLAVDTSWRLYYSKKSIKKFKWHWPAVLRHELEHLIREHSSRKKYRDHYLFNVAGDAEINDDIPNLPSNAVFPKCFGEKDGETAEYYYEKIPRDKKYVICDGGSGAGRKIKGELPEAKNSSEGIPKDEQEDLINRIAEDVIDHKSHKSMGNKIGEGTIVWAQARIKKREKIPRKLPWRTAIRKTLLSLGKTDFSYKKSSRRQEEKEEIIYPGLVSSNPTVSVVVDTSGSMGVDEGDWIASVFRELILSEIDCIVIPCDAQCYKPFKLKSHNDAKKCVGGGGTNMIVGIEKAKKYKNNLIIILSDGETPWPQKWDKNMIGLIRKNEKTEVKYE